MMVPKSTPGPDPSVPSTAQIASVLRERIRSGVYSVDSWLPAERALAEELGVHRRVIRAAISRLAEEGLLSLRSRCRPVVVSAHGREAARPFLPAPVRLASGFPAARLVALVMWHGGFEQGATAQQRIFWGMNQALAQAGYHGVFLDLGADIGSEEENATREAARLRYVLEHDFGGVVFYAYAYRSNRALIQDVARHTPLVLIDRMLPGVQADFVGIDNHRAMFEATNHLLEQGHRRIVYITRAEPINTVQDRLDGYRQALRHFPAPDLREVILTATFTKDEEWAGTEWPVFDTLFRLPDGERPSAVLCVNDYVAAHVAQRLHSLGLRFPQEVALIGFDDIIQMLPGGVGLTTVAQPFEEIGRVAAQTFLRRHASPGQPLMHQELPARLIVRASSGFVRDPACSGSILVQETT